MFAAAGIKQPEDALTRAVIGNSVGYYPRRALDLERYFRQGLLDPKTGLLRMHLNDSGTSIRPIKTDIERYLSLEKGKADGADQLMEDMPRESSRPAPPLTDANTRKSERPARQERRQPSRERAKRAIEAIYPKGVPDQDAEPNKAVSQKVAKWLTDEGLPEVLHDTIMRAADRRK